MYGRTKIYTHTNFGFTVKTNLSDEELALAYPTEAALAAFFVKAGSPILGEKVPEPVAPARKQRYRISGPRPFATADWLTKGACQNVSADYDANFTPAVDMSRQPWPILLAEPLPEIRQIRTALEICSTCPVSTACFTQSISENARTKNGESGIWAGTAEIQRRHFYRMRGMKRTDADVPNRLAGKKDDLLCTRCLRQTDGEKHLSDTVNKNCAGAVTSIRREDAITAIYAPEQEKLVRAI